MRAGGTAAPRARAGGLALELFSEFLKRWRRQSAGGAGGGACGGGGAGAGRATAFCAASRAAPRLSPRVTAAEMGSHTSCPSETCPVSTERWTRRVHFVREGGGGGVPAPPPASPGCTPRGAVSARTGGPVAGWQAGGRGAPAGVAHGGGAGIGDVARRQELALALRRGRRRAGLRAGAAAVRARARRTGRKLRQVVPRRARLTTEGAPRAGACLERGAGREDACARARGACLSARAARPGARGAGGGGADRTQGRRTAPVCPTCHRAARASRPARGRGGARLTSPPRTEGARARGGQGRAGATVAAPETCSKWTRDAQAPAQLCGASS